MRAEKSGASGHERILRAKCIGTDYSLVAVELLDVLIKDCEFDCHVTYPIITNSTDGTTPLFLLS